MKLCCVEVVLVQGGRVGEYVVAGGYGVILVVGDVETMYVVYKFTVFYTAK